eukprot:7423549-Pyramimonas_sp.AAC.1
MRRLLSEPPPLDQVVGHVRDLTADALSATWFNVRKAKKVAYAVTGTRPGPPPAGVHFSLALSPIHQRLQARLEDADLSWDLLASPAPPQDVFRRLGGSPRA